MSDTQGADVPAQLVLHGDDDTPREFIIDLLRRVFGKSESEAESVFADIERRGAATCGPYPSSVAGALLESARRRVVAAGHPLLITGETAKPLRALRPTHGPVRSAIGGPHSVAMR